MSEVMAAAWNTDAPSEAGAPQTPAQGLARLAWADPGEPPLPTERCGSLLWLDLPGRECSDNQPYT